MKNNYKISFLILCFISLIIYVFGVEFESYEGMLNALMSGALLGKPCGDLYIYGYVFISKLYTIPFSYFPNFPFYTIGSLLILFVSYSTFGIVLFSENKKYFFLYVCALTIFAENIILISNTRISFSVTALSIVSFFCIEKTNLGPIKYYLLNLLCALLIFYGFCVRYEAAVIAMGVTLLFIFSTKIVYIKKVKYRLAGLLVLIFSLSYSLLQRADENPYLQKLHNLTYLTAVSSHKLQSYQPSKSVLFSASLNNYFVADTAFFNKMMPQFPSSANILFLKIQYILKTPSEIRDSFSNLLNESKNEMVFILLITFLSFLFIENRWRLFFITCLALVLIISISVIIKSVPRFSSPYLLIIALFNLLIFARQNPKNSSYIIYSLVFVIFIPISLIQAKKEIASIKENASNNLKYMDIINKLPQKIVALNMNSVNIFNTGAYRVARFDKSKYILPIDMGDFTCIRSISAQIKDDVGINSMNCEQEYSFIADHDVVYLSSRARVLFIESYLRELYNLRIDFVPLNEQLNISPFQIDGEKIFLYKVVRL